MPEVNPPSPTPSPPARPRDYETDMGSGCLIGGMVGLFLVPAWYVVAIAVGTFEYDGFLSVVGMFILVPISVFICGMLGTAVGFIHSWRQKSHNTHNNINL